MRFLLVFVFFLVGCVQVPVANDAKKRSQEIPVPAPLQPLEDGSRKTVLKWINGTAQAYGQCRLDVYELKRLLEQ